MKANIVLLIALLLIFSCSQKRSSHYTKLSTPIFVKRGYIQLDSGTQAQVEIVQVAGTNISDSNEVPWCGMGFRCEGFFQIISKVGANKPLTNDLNSIYWRGTEYEKAPQSLRIYFGGDLFSETNDFNRDGTNDFVLWQYGGCGACHYKKIFTFGPMGNIVDQPISTGLFYVRGNIEMISSNSIYYHYYAISPKITNGNRFSQYSWNKNKKSGHEWVLVTNREHDGSDGANSM